MSSLGLDADLMSRPRPSPRWHLDLGFIFLSFDIFGIFVFFFSFIGDGGGAAGPSSLRVFRRGARPTTRRPDWTCHNSINRLYMTFFSVPYSYRMVFFLARGSLCAVPGPSISPSRGARGSLSSSFL